jgi:preprotein translocase subunit YajC
MTGSGLIATIVSIDGDEVTLEVAPGVTNRYLRRSIMRVVPDDTTEPIGADMAESQPDKDPMIEPMSDDGASRGTERTNRNDITDTSP